MRRRIVRVMMVALAVLSVLGWECDPKLARFFDPIDDLIPVSGGISGMVTVDGQGRSGVTVTVRQGTQVLTTTTTDGDGDYEVLNLAPGTYTVSIPSIPGASCPGDQTAVVVADDETEVDFACTTTPTTGTVTGTVTAGGSPISGATVALDGQTTTTDANGTYTFTNVAPDSYSVTVTADGFQCDPRTTTVTAGQTSTVDFACTSSSPSGSEIAANPFRLMGTLMGTDGCGFGSTISNPGPIDINFDMVANTLTIVSDANVVGLYVLGQPWTGTGESTFSSGGMTFILRETATGTWQRMGGTIVLPGTLTFEVFQGSTKTCESRYNVTYEALTPSSISFKSDVAYLLPDGLAILGLRPVAHRYLAPYGDPAVLRVGLIAEHVVRTFPGAVALDGGGEPRGIYYVTLSRLVIEEIATRAGEAAQSWIARLAGAM
ncbi:MAG: carboxypeptidase regulatory-like domain-containing protein [Gemmatimonadota bacterium]